MVSYDMALTVAPGRRPPVERELLRLAQGRRLKVVAIQPWELDLFRERLASGRIRIGTLVSLPAPAQESASGRGPLLKTARRAGVRILDAGSDPERPREARNRARGLMRRARKA